MSKTTTATTRAQKLARRHRRAAIIGPAVVLAAVVIAYGKGISLPGAYKINATFSSANQLRPGSDVRIAGVKVGEVRGFKRGPGDTTTVTMHIDDEGRPVHTDATMRIVPRLVLEGNDYIDLDPGTGSAPEIEAGATVSRSRTSAPVQLDQVLSTLDLAGRNDLHGSIAGLAAGLGPTAPTGRNITGAAGLRRAARALAASLDSTRDVAAAARGVHPGDLPRTVGSAGEFLSQLSADPAALSNIITNYDRVAGAIADNNRAMSASLVRLRDITRDAPPTLRALDSALPEVETFANRLRPVLQTAPSSFTKLNRLVDQVRGVTRQRELPRAQRALSPIARIAPRTLSRAKELFPQLTAVADCIAKVVVPTLSEKIEDGPNTTGDPVWLEALHSGTTLAGGSPNYDGNGSTIRLGLSFGESALEGVIPGVGTVVGGGPEIEGVRPTWLGPGVDPPKHPEAKCADQAIPNLGLRSGPAPRWANHRVNRRGR